MGRVKFYFDTAEGNIKQHSGYRPYVIDGTYTVKNIRLYDSEKGLLLGLNCGAWFEYYPVYNGQLYTHSTHDVKGIYVPVVRRLKEKFDGSAFYIPTGQDKFLGKMCNLYIPIESMPKYKVIEKEKSFDSNEGFSEHFFSYMLFENNVRLHLKSWTETDFDGLKKKFITELQAAENKEQVKKVLEKYQFAF